MSTSTETQILVTDTAPRDHQPVSGTPRLSPEDLWRYRQNGFLIFERLFSPAELDLIKAELPAIFSEDSARRVLEKSGSVRSVFASHLTNELFDRFARLARLVEPAKQILGDDVYVHQFKINAKVALEGDQWEWHQDYLYWLKEDSMPRPTVLTAVLFVEETNEFNGPMLIIPGSHLDGVVDIDVHSKYRETGNKNESVPQQWAATLTADLKYKIDKDILKRLMEERSIRTVTVPAGSVMFFHGNLFHASTNNLSPWDRISIFVSYNSVTNALHEKENPRPEFIAARDFRPLEPVEDDALLAWEAGR
jgi:ectoine hydroxylase-related dioxygenase (phytanoyl-CoA dioxygenase family)